MMKYLICLLLALLAPVSAMVGQTLGLEDLGVEESFEFNRARLAVEVNSQSYFFMYQGTGGGGTSRSVRYYQGFDRIREEELFRIAGYLPEYEQARRHRIVNQRLLIGSWTLIGASVVGLIGMVTVFIEPLPDWDDPNYRAISDDQNNRLYGWAGLGLGGSLLSLVPSLIALARGQHRYSPTQALQVADIYNRQLINEITSD